MKNFSLLVTYITLTLNGALLTKHAMAQTPDEEMRSVHNLTFVSTSFLNTWEPSVYVGYRYQISLRTSRKETNDLGDTVFIPPRWYAHSQAKAGYAFDSDENGSGGLAGSAQLGLLYRVDEGPFNLQSMGLVGQVNWGPKGYGPAARFEFYGGNAALIIGWMYFDDERTRSDGIFVSIDLLKGIFRDLGLVR